MTPTTENPLHRLTPEQIEEIGREFDALHDEVFEDLGERDAAYIRGIIALHRRLVLMGRLELLASKNPFDARARARPRSPRPRSWRTWRSATT